MKNARHIWDTAGMGVVLALIIAACWIWVPNFSKMENLGFLLLSISIIGTVACTMLYCLAGGDFDLSVGSTVALAGVLATQVAATTHNPWLAMAVSLVVGAFIGLVNGFVIAKIQINALITTLATMQIVRGVAYLRTGGASVPADASLVGLASWKFIGLTAEVWYMIAAFIIFGYVLNRTVFGRNILAVGGNPEASRLAGINIVKTKIAIFVLQGLVAAFVGVVLASRTFMGDAKAQQGLELQVISGCVLGGVSLAGGVGTMSGVIIGVLIMGIMQNSMNLLSVDTYWQSVASGAVLLAAVMLDRLKAKGRNS